MLLAAFDPALAMLSVVFTVTLQTSSRYSSKETVLSSIGSEPITLFARMFIKTLPPSKKACVEFLKFSNDAIIL